MEFNSWTFIAFLVLAVSAFRFLGSPVSRNWLLLSASYFFYAMWDWRFLSLIILSTVTDWLCARAMTHSEDTRRKHLLWISLGVNLGMLAIFKYFNFFVSSFADLLTSFGLNASAGYLEIVLPVGISFYTFQTLSYSIDVYRRKLEPEPNLLNFAVFVSFFPQLVAGPIERAKNILPQLRISTRLSLDDFKEGITLIGWGLFKKVFVADNLALIVDPLYAKSYDLTAAETYIATLAFAFQIYADFSAYTDIARGSAKLFGIDLMQNFDSPYRSLNPQEFWRRWHISLSTWLRDYLYIGLGGNRGGAYRTYQNLFLTMVLGGLWHGAAWNYVWWGIYHGALLCIHRILTSYSWFQVPRAIAWFSMFHLTLFGWMLFRSTRTEWVDDRLVDKSGEQLFQLLATPSNGWYSSDSALLLASTMLFAVPMIFVEWLSTRRQQGLTALSTNPILGPLLLGALGFLVFRWGVQNSGAFIYFQF